MHYFCVKCGVKIVQPGVCKACDADSGVDAVKADAPKGKDKADLKADADK